MDKALENQIKLFMAQALAEGKSLSEIQTLVNNEFSLNMTYMDIRIIASTLDVDWQKVSPAPQKAEPAPPASDPEAAVEEESAPADAAGEEEEDEMPPLPQPSGKTQIDFSKLARPGMMVSGSVTFANGSTAEWFLDNMGRLGLENLNGDQPSQEDVQDFQITLQHELRKYMGR